MIKLFEQFTNEQEIRDICKKYKITNYTINPDGSIDVDGSVYLNNKGLTKLPLKFNKVIGTFEIFNNQLTSLEGSPKEVSGTFDCFNNQLTSLIGGPERVDGGFKCTYNKLTSLKGSPERVGGYFKSSYNKISSLEGSPIIINGYLELIDNPISIIDSSVEVKGDIYLDDTNFDDKIKSLSQDKLRILFEHGVDYDIFRKDGSINDSRLERLFIDFEI